jgi:hypothetical protein
MRSLRAAMPYNSGMSHSRFVLLRALPVVMLLGGCSGLAPAQKTATAPSAPGWQACEGERPMVCTMIYDPVCGRQTDGALDVYASPCNACADVTVTAWHPESCEE